MQDVRLFLHGESPFRFPTGIMARLLLESNRNFELSFDYKIQKSCRETAGTLFIEGGVVYFSNEESRPVFRNPVHLEGVWLRLGDLSFTERIDP